MIASVLSTRATAQSVVTEVPPWNAASVGARAAERSPAVQSAATEAAALDALHAFGRVPYFGNPTVGLRAMVGVPDVPAATLSVAVGLPFDVSGRRARFVREADLAVREGRLQYQLAVNEARARALDAYIETAVADALVRVTAARVETARELLAQTEARRRSEDTTELDRVLAERELADAEAGFASARREREAAVDRLRERLDLGPDVALRVEPLGPPTVPAGMTREVAATLAVQRRLDARGLSASAARWRAVADRWRATAVDRLVLVGEYEVQGYTQSSFGVSMQWALPVWQLNQGERAVALAEARGRETRVALVERQVAREAAGAFTQFVLRLDELGVLRDRAVPSLERALALTQQLFDAGAADHFRVLLARQDLAAMRFRQAEAMREAWRARVELERSTGGTWTDGP